MLISGRQHILLLWAYRPPAVDTPDGGGALLVIGTNNSCPTDPVFAFQVRLQLVTHRASRIREQHDVARARIATVTPSSSIPDLLYLKTLQAQLRELQASIPSEVYQRGG